MYKIYQLAVSSIVSNIEQEIYQLSVSMYYEIYKFTLGKIVCTFLVAKNLRKNDSNMVQKQKQKSGLSTTYLV